MAVKSKQTPQMLDDIPDIQNLSHKNVWDNLYSPIINEIKKVKGYVNEYLAEDWQENKDIVSIVNHEIFNFSNWQIKNGQQSVSENYITNILQASFIRTFGNNISRDKIYNDVYDRFLQDSIESLHQKQIIDGICDNYEYTVKINKNVYERKKANIHSFYERTVTETEGYLYNDNITARISTIHNKIENETTENVNKISQIKERKKFLESINCPHTGETYEVVTRQPTTTATGLKEIRCSGCDEMIRTETQPIIQDEYNGEIHNVENTSETPFKNFVSGALKKAGMAIYDFFTKPLKGLFAGLSSFFNKLKERFAEFADFISGISGMPAFWFSLIFACANGFFFYRIFRDMFMEDISIILMFLSIYSVIFAILPFFASKHLDELLNQNKKFGEIIIMIVFELIIFALAASYTIMTYQNRNIFGDNEQNQKIAAIAIGIVPFITSLITGFTNYRYLKNNS